MPSKILIAINKYLFFSFVLKMSVRKTIVGTNTSLNGDTVSSSVDIISNPSNNIVNNLNVTVRNSEAEIEKLKEEIPENPYETMVKYPSITTSEKDLEILRFLMKTFQDIIISDPECVANIIDQSGLVILSVDKLIRLIALVCEVNDENVKIEIESSYEVGCCGAASKLLPLKQIRKIKVMKNGDVFNDFQLTYNDCYNTIIDIYRVSLESVYQKLI